MTDYMNWVKEMFPSIDPYTHERALLSVKEFIRERRYVEFLKPTPFSFLTQGDVIGNLIFNHFSEDGDYIEFGAPGILLSNTCDAENDNWILFSPLIPIAHAEKYGFNPATIINNLYTRLLYIPNPPLNDYFIDLSICNSYSRDLISKGMERDTFPKMSSLSLIGFYFFLSKITVHLMRPEDKGVQEKRTA